MDEDQVKDESIIEQLAGLIASASNVAQVKHRLRDAQSGYDNFSLLHYATKNFRAKVARYLIEEIEIGSLNKNDDFQKLFLRCQIYKGQINK